MSKEHFGAVIDSETGLVRSLIEPDHDRELDDPLHTPHPRLKMHKLRHDQHWPELPFAKKVHLVVGKLHGARSDKQAPIDARCAVIANDGVVLGLVMAIPGIDEIEDHRLVLTQDAQLGDLYENERFMRWVALVDMDGIVREIRKIDVATFVKPDGMQVFFANALKVGERAYEPEPDC